MTEQPPPGPPPPGPPPPGGPQPPGYQSPYQDRPGQPPAPYSPAPYSPNPHAPGPHDAGPDEIPPPQPPQSQLGTWLLLGLVLAGLVAGGVWWLRGQTAVDDLRVGDCLVSDDLEAGNQTVEKVDIVDCTNPHDGEVVAGLVVDDQTARSGYTGSVGAQECAKAAPDLAGRLELRPLAPARDLVAGDKVPCVARNVDGSQLTGTLVG